MPRFKLLIEYAGTRYSGWQIQKNARTVQGEIDRAIRTIAPKAAFELYGAGRTDAGVHALGQVAHLELHTAMPPPTLVARLNDELPSDINILCAEKVLHRFHARHDALARSYLYQIARRRTAFAKPYVWWIKDDLDTATMREAAQSMVGMADFRSFTDDDPDEKSTVVEVSELTVLESGDLILIRVVGSHFLWKMVRRMLGVLAEAGRGRLTAASAGRFLGERSASPPRSPHPRPDYSSSASSTPATPATGRSDRQSASRPFTHRACGG